MRRPIVRCRMRLWRRTERMTHTLPTRRTLTPARGKIAAVATLAVGLLVALAGGTIATSSSDEQTSQFPPDCRFVKPEIKTPVVNIRDFGAVGDGFREVADALDRAIASLPSGGTVHFPPGIYAHNAVLEIRAPNIILSGTDATLLATNPDQAAVKITGTNSGIRDLTISANPADERGERDEHSGIIIAGRSNTVISTSVSRTKSAGIFVSGGQNYVIACNTIFDTLADGIHSTDGASGGRVIGNRVRNSGDDGIALVSYRGRAPASQIVIEDNDVAQIRWGRGISVIGSTGAVIRRNRVSAIAMAAGIIVAREASFNTPGAREVLIEDNTIGDIQQSLQPAPGRRRTGHAAIEINSDGSSEALAVSDVKILRNRVSGSGYDGIRLLGNIDRISIDSNMLDSIAGRPIRNISGTQVTCQANRASGAASRCD